MGGLVLGIWGTIGYKIISGVNPVSLENNNQIISSKYTFDLKQEKDTFSIKPQSKDPFLGAITFPKKANDITPHSTPQKKVNFPKVVYKGILKTQKSADKIFVVSVNNKEHLLKLGQTIDSVKLVSGNSERIVVRYNNTTETLVLKQ